MSDSEHTELKAGHPPAMMVGGRRVPLPKHHEEKPAAEAPQGEEGAEEKDKPNANKTVVISGAHVKDKDVYSAEAARAIHEKPMPTHSPASTANHFTGYGSSKSQIITQPRKS